MKRKNTAHRLTLAFGVAGLFCVALTLASFAISGNPNNWGGIPFFFALLFEALAVLSLAVQILESL